MKFFYLQKSDRNTILLLLCIIVAAIAVIQLTDSEKPSEGIEQETTDKKQKNASAKSPKTYTYSQGLNQN